MSTLTVGEIRAERAKFDLDQSGDWIVIYFKRLNELGAADLNNASELRDGAFWNVDDIYVDVNVMGRRDKSDAIDDASGVVKDDWNNDTGETIGFCVVNVNDITDGMLSALNARYCYAAD